MTKLTIFNKWTPSRNDGSTVVTDSHTGLNILQVGSLPSLIQALGYVKYLYPGKRIFYRGQHHLHCEKKDTSGNCLFQPSILRGTGRDTALRSKRLAHLSELIAEIRTTNPRFESTKEFISRFTFNLNEPYPTCFH